ncbi:hypothetical protein F444_17976 [Phytophthora nicotianae P1976]|uniref:Uncharacterized protein n=1 Tax=Phytophthora nicotianae P1976 TaxID=1317066 RepID=A0A080ZD01_PHYNI|nr:hypothetical protein F444_17976 [Phytophthora nicotianae P1976]
MAGGYNNNSDDEDEARRLIAEVREEVLQQQREEATHQFVSVKKLRSFARTESRPTTQNVSAIMVVESISRLDNNRGTRLGLVDGFMKNHLKGYINILDKNDLRDTRVFKRTVWDPNNRSTGRTRFEVGNLYKFRKIHSLSFYHELLQGCLQSVAATNPGLIEEFPDFDSAKRALGRSRWLS